MTILSKYGSQNIFEAKMCQTKLLNSQEFKSIHPGHVQLRQHHRAWVYIVQRGWKQTAGREERDEEKIAPLPFKP